MVTDGIFVENSIDLGGLSIFSPNISNTLFYSMNIIAHILKIFDSKVSRLLYWVLMGLGQKQQIDSAIL